MKLLLIVITLITGTYINASFAENMGSEIFLTLPETFNSPASSDFDSQGNIYFTSPNFHNEVLIKAGDMKKPAAPTIGKINKNNQFTTWYTFKAEDMDKTSGKVAPMGIAFGPDGNAYVADIQLWFGGNSRILRINVENGKATSVETVATGFSFPNAVVFKGNDMFVSDTVLATENGKQISGVYKINIAELSSKKPVQIKPYVNKNEHDAHIFETFKSNAKLQFGANGLTIDGDGNLYTSIMEDGSVIKTTMDEHNNKIASTLLVTGFMATDGLKWDQRTNKLYLTDLFANAVYSIELNGAIKLLAQNGNTNGANGELDGPSELIVRGNEVIVMNFDAVFNSPEMINKKADNVHNLSVIKIK